MAKDRRLGQSCYSGTLLSEKSASCTPTEHLLQPPLVSQDCRPVRKRTPRSTTKTEAEVGQESIRQGSTDGLRTVAVRVTFAAHEMRVHWVSSWAQTRASCHMRMT